MRFNGAFDSPIFVRNHHTSLPLQ